VSIEDTTSHHNLSGKKKKAEIMQADNRTYTIDYEGMEKMNGLFTFGT